MNYFILANERLNSVSFQDDFAVFNLIRYFKTLLSPTLQPQNSWSFAFTWNCFWLNWYHLVSMWKSVLALKLDDFFKYGLQLIFRKWDFWNTIVYCNREEKSLTQTDFSHGNFAHWGKNFVDTMGVKQVSALRVEGLFEWNQTPV